MRREPLFDGSEQLVDSSLRRIGPFRLRDQVDLSPVQALGHDLGAKPSLGEARDDLGCSRIEGRLLLRRRLSALDQLGAVLVDAEDFGAAVQAEQETPGPAWSRTQL